MWGWKKSKNDVIPIRKVNHPVPQILLEQIACGNRKLGISYSMFCKECVGINCDNVEVSDVSEQDIIGGIDAGIDIQLEKISFTESFVNVFL